MEGASILDVLSRAPAALGASARTAERAQRYVAEGRISRPDVRARRIAAYVSDGRGARVKARLELAEGELEPRCSCRGKGKGRKPCAHAAALALLLAGEARPPAPGEAGAESLEARQIRRRVERGRSGLFEIEPEERNGTALGGYRVSSPSERDYRVVLRTVDARENSCTCEDLRTNRIGTCKHIEAVLSWLARGRRRSWLNRARRTGPTRSYLYVHAPSGEIGVRLKRRPGRGARRLAERWFDAEGRLAGSLAEAWPELSADADQSGVEVPDEVRACAQRAIEASARESRRRRVEAEVRRAGAEQPGFAGRLYPYQVDGVAFLASRGRAILADDMGLGKTAQAIAAAARMFRKGQVARALVVCPASLKDQWAKEIARFAGGSRALSATVVSGGRRQRAALYRSAGDVVIVNYELARSDRAEIAGLGADLLILDEAQRIKNWRTKTADAIKRIESRYAFVLTGTPLENRLDDLYSLMQVVDPHVLGPLWCFNRDFVTVDERGRPTGYRNLAELRERIRPCFLRRRKREVLDQLPEVLTTRRSIALSPPQRDVHDEAQAQVAKLLARLKKRPLTPAEEQRLLRGFQRMRMACDAPELVSDRKARGGAPKLAELARLFEEICVDGGSKVVVFTEWERMQRLAAQTAKQLGIGFVRLHGGVPGQKRGALIRRFSEDPSCQIFFSTDAGGVGLNLQAASHVINLDLPWNPAVLAQRIARVHRLGQKEAVNVVLLVGEESIEERMEHTLEGKRALFEAAVGDDTETEELERTTLARRVATLLAESYAATTGPGQRAGDGEGETAPPKESGRPAGAEGVASLQKALGGALERVLETRDGRLWAVVADGTEVPAPGLDGAVALPASAARALSELGEDSPIAAAEVRYQAPATDGEAKRRRGQLDAASRKLDAARALESAGHGAEALSLLRDTLALASRAAAERDPGESQDGILAAVYGDLVPAGALLSEDAHALTRAGELARAFSVSPVSPPGALTRALAADASNLLGRLREQLGSQSDASAPDLRAA